MSRFRKSVLFGLFVAISGMLVGFLDFAHEIEENAGLGLLFHLRGVRAAPPEVVIVSIDRESSEKLRVADNPDRWPRTLHARLIDALVKGGASAITFDLYFIEPRPGTEDSFLADAIQSARNVVLAQPLKSKDIPAAKFAGVFTSEEHRIVEAIKPLEQVSRYAFGTAPFVLPQLPVKVNQYWLFQTAAGDSPTFPIVAFQLYALPACDEFLRLLERVDPAVAGKLPANSASAIAGGAVRFIREVRSVFEGDASLAPRMSAELERSGLVARDPTRYSLVKSLINMYGGSDHRYLNYYGPPRTMTTVPFYRVVQSQDVLRADGAIDFNGKAVFVGLSEVSLTEKKDSFYTTFSRPDGVFLGGTEIAATAFANLLQNTPVSPVSLQVFLSIAFCWGLLVAAIGCMSATATGALGIVAVSGIYLFFAKSMFQMDGTWYPVIVPLFIQSPLAVAGAVLWNYFESNKQRQNIRKALSYYVPDEVVDHLAENIADIRRDGQTVYGVCLFTDCAGYTTVSETMAARELSDFMHRYFSVIFDPVKQSGGLVVDLKGDAVIAVWRGAQTDPALRGRACDAALGIARAVRQFNDSLESFKLPTRIAVHAGEIFLGNIGAAEHYQYGVTGDTVNTASRMDSLNKYLGTEILVSDEATHQVQGFLTREAGVFLLKGKAQPIRVRQLLCRAEQADEMQQKACALFAEGLSSFQACSWSRAEERFRECADLLGGDPLSRFYLALCERYAKQPPGETWAGVIEMDDK